MTTNAPAGWYADPNLPGTERLWDGESWTDLTRSVAAPPPPPPAPEPTVVLPVETPVAVVAHPGTTPWYQRPAVLVGGGVMGALLLVAAVNGGSDDTKESASTPTAPTATVTVEAPADPVDESVDETPVAQPTAKPAKPKTTSKAQVGSQPKSDGDTFTMPDETGKVLQAAQDDLQAVSGDPFYVSFSEDATGEDRFQMMDSNWTVCSQSIAPGDTVTLEDDVTFYVVYYDEDCP